VVLSENVAGYKCTKPIRVLDSVRRNQAPNSRWPNRIGARKKGYGRRKDGGLVPAMHAVSDRFGRNRDDCTQL
jgi:hypothetical protein